MRGDPIQLIQKVRGSIPYQYVKGIDFSLREKNTREAARLMPRQASRL
jgi:hypothetical protein